jgi:short-subunit dehydrogenase
MRNILVTGASSGIGRAIARKLLDQGYWVYGVSRDRQKFITKHSRFIGLTLDLADLDALPENAQQWHTDYPEIDAIVFSAGYGQFGSLEQFSYQQIRALMDVNFTAQALLARSYIPWLRKKSRADLIFIGSEAALQGSRKGAIYCASKFAIRGFSQALRQECASSGVKVSLINPGMVKTEFFETLTFEPGASSDNYIEPGDVAEAVSYVLNSQPGIIIDEINLNPLNKVVRFK